VTGSNESLDDDRGPAAPPTDQGSASAPCPYCGGTAEIRGANDDVEFLVACTCAGGSEETVRWLLGLNEPGDAQDWCI
jgi:hypothetical protein